MFRWCKPAGGERDRGGQLVGIPLPQHELRYVRFDCHEYLGEAVAISNVEVAARRALRLTFPPRKTCSRWPRTTRLKSPAATTSRPPTPTSSRSATPPAANCSRASCKRRTSTPPSRRSPTTSQAGARRQVYTIRKELKRIDPGERIIVEIVDYDEDRTERSRHVKFQVLVNDGEPVELEATETEQLHRHLHQGNRYRLPRRRMASFR